MSRPQTDLPAPGDVRLLLEDWVVRVDHIAEGLQRLPLQGRLSFPIVAEPGAVESRHRSGHRLRSEDRMCKMSYMTLSSQEKPLKNSLMTPIFLLCSCFRARPTTLLFKILGGPMHWPFPPPQILGGPSPLGLRPWSDVITFPQGVT